MPRILSFDLGFRNLSYCLLDLEPGLIPEILRWGTDTITELTKPTASNIIEAGSEWIMTNQWTYLEPDIVVFETQMKINQKMQKLAASMHSTIHTMTTLVGSNIKCFYIKPRVKFDIFIFDDIPTKPTKSDRGSLYRWRKQVAVSMAKCFLRRWNADHHLELFEECNCNPDMADSLTNGCAFAYSKFEESIDTILT